jgi:hypothetical protein
MLAFHVDPNKGEAGFTPHRDRQPIDVAGTWPHFNARICDVSYFGGRAVVPCKGARVFARIMVHVCAGLSVRTRVCNVQRVWGLGGKSGGVAWV